jgi:hypothetical protein
MSEYKLIKKLPFEDSPEIGYISEPTKEKDGAHYWNKNWFHPEKYPEFWEKIIKPTFEILSFSQNISNEVVAVSKTDLALTVEEFFKNINWNIHSVKRLSDNEIFTVGNTIYSDDFKPTKLEKITIRDNGSIAMWGKYHSNMLVEIGLPSCVIKQPLFITKDKIEIFEGDSYFTCFPLSNVINGPYIAHNDGDNWTVPYVNFSSFKAAQDYNKEYDLMNKRCLSINDILSISTENILIGTHETKNTMLYYLCQLKKLAKSKL